MLHRQEPPFTIEELKEKLNKWRLKQGIWFYIGKPFSNESKKGFFWHRIDAAT
jgi:hypothetical protein